MVYVLSHLTTDIPTGMPHPRAARRTAQYQSTPDILRQPLRSSEKHCTWHSVTQGTGRHPHKPRPSISNIEGGGRTAANTQEDNTLKAYSSCRQCVCRWISVGARPVACLVRCRAGARPRLCMGMVRRCRSLWDRGYIDRHEKQEEESIKHRPALGHRSSLEVKRLDWVTRRGHEALFCGRGSVKASAGQWNVALSVSLSSSSSLGVQHVLPDLPHPHARSHDILYNSHFQVMGFHTLGLALARSKADRISLCNACNLRALAGRTLRIRHPRHPNICVSHSAVVIVLVMDVLLPFSLCRTG